MNSHEIMITVCTASADEIISHLQDCSIGFQPPLDSYVDIPVYSRKLYDNAVIIEAWKGKELVGMIACYMNEVSGPAFISNVSLLPTMKGQGVGGRLLKKCMVMAHERGSRKIKLEVRGENYTARRFYEKHGFHVLLDDGVKLVMERNLLENE